MRRMEDIGEIRPGEGFEVFWLPAVRIIGKEARCGGPLGNTAPGLVAEAFASDAWQVALRLPRVIENHVDWMGDHDPADDTFSFVHCVIVPAGTPVPEGLVYRDLAETACGKGVDGESEQQTFARAAGAGYVENYGGNPWNIEVFFPEEDTSCWVVPVTIG